MDFSLRVPHSATSLLGRAPAWTSWRLAVVASLALFAALVLQVEPANGRDDSTPNYPAPLSLDWQVSESGLVRALITNWGQVGSTPGTQAPFASEPSAQWPGRSDVDYLWVGGFWFGARQNGVPRVTTAAYATELHPGLTAESQIYASRAGAAGGNRAPSPAADDDADGHLDEDWLDGRDNDNDGDVDEDFAAISDEMLASTYTDFTVLPNHVALGLELRQATFTWSRPELEDFIGFDIHLTNVGATSLTDFHVGFFADCDIGFYPDDDLSGFWEGNVSAKLEGDVRDVPVSLAYMYDRDGDQGTAPGLIGFVFLDSPASTPWRLTNFRMFHGNSPYASGGDPTNDTERLACLDGTSPVSLPTPGELPRASVLAPSDADWRILASVGPWPMLTPGSSIDVAMAMVFGSSLEDLQQNAARAQMLYDGVSADCDGNPQTPEECIVHWTTPRTVPVVLEHLAAWRASESAHVEWQVRAAAQHEILGLRLHRGQSESGPFQPCTAELLTPTVAHFEDRAAPAGVVWYRLEILQRDGTTSMTRAVSIDALPLTQSDLGVPRLGMEDVTIQWSLAESTPMRLTIHDVSGRLVRTLRQGVLPFGHHTLVWDRTTASGLPVARGIYVVRLETGATVRVRKLALVGG